MLLLPPRLSSDDRLARLAAGGRDDAFSALYERHQPALFAYSRAILRDDDDARDALQDAALKALTALGRSDAPTPPSEPAPAETETETQAQTQTQTTLPEAPPSEPAPAAEEPAV